MLACRGSIGEKASVGATMPATSKSNAELRYVKRLLGDMVLKVDGPLVVIGADKRGEKTRAVVNESNPEQNE